MIDTFSPILDKVITFSFFLFIIFLNTCKIRKYVTNCEKNRVFCCNIRKWNTREKMGYWVESW